MFTCICHAVTDQRIAQAVDAGAQTIDEVGDLTYAGTGCGTCHDRIEQIIDQRCGATCPVLVLAGQGAGQAAGQAAGQGAGQRVA